MLRLAADENFNNDILRGLVRRRPDVDIVTIQDVEVAGAEDAIMLAWAAREGRVLLTHDGRTIPPIAYDRARAGLAMPGVFEVDLDLPVGSAIDELLLLIECSVEGEWEGRVCYLPLRG